MITVEKILRVKAWLDSAGEANGVAEILFLQFRFPKTRKRRIREKWSKRPKNWRAVHGFMRDGIFHPLPKWP